MPIALVSSLALLIASASAAPWNGTLRPDDRLGVYLDVPEADQVSFALMEEGGDALEALFPQSAWSLIDSTPITVGKLGGLGFAALGRLGDTAGPDEAARREQATTLGKRLGFTHILVLRKGGFKAGRDSVAAFSDQAVFTLRETATGTGLLHEQGSFSAARGKRSAESQWAKDAWGRFSKSVTRQREQAK